MPFKSEKQRKYMHANHPEIAKRWEKEYKKGGRVKVNEGGYIGPSIRGKSRLAVGNKQPVSGSGAARRQKDVTWV